MVEGKLQREGDVIHIIVQHCYNLSAFLRILTTPNQQSPLLTLARADETSAPPYSSHPGANKKTALQTGAQEKIFPKGRDFK